MFSYGTGKSCHSLMVRACSYWEHRPKTPDYPVKEARLHCLYFKAKL